MNHTTRSYAIITIDEHLRLRDLDFEARQEHRGETHLSRTLLGVLTDGKEFITLDITYFGFSPEHPDLWMVNWEGPEDWLQGTVQEYLKMYFPCPRDFEELIVPALKELDLWWESPVKEEGC
jgi:hypothetical protein